MKSTWTNFDSYYDHLFVWRKSQREIVGAYRLGLTDSILRKYGKKAFTPARCLISKTASLAV
jgi:hypothetical protein